MRNLFSVPKFKQPKIASPKLPKNAGLLSMRAEGRVRIKAALKKKVYEKCKGKCAHKGCKQTRFLQIHHKNQKNSDNNLSNLVLLCPNHHAEAHSKEFRRRYGTDITGRKKTRLVKKKPKTKKKRIRKRRTSSPLGLRIKPLKW